MAEALSVVVMNYFTNHIIIADEDDHLLSQLAFDQHCPDRSLQFVADELQLLGALAKSSFTPSLILLDFNMPRLNGFETLQILRYAF